jgi:copper chaperone
MHQQKLKSSGQVCQSPLTLHDGTGDRWRSKPPAKEPAMLAFRVDDMTCGHCASTMSKAVRAIDADARVEIDLARQLVRIDPTNKGSGDLSKAIAEAGYTPVQVEQRPSAAATVHRAVGCCCGGGGSGMPRLKPLSRGAVGAATPAAC